MSRRRGVALSLAAALVVGAAPSRGAASTYGSTADFGLGVYLGEPIGITMKGFLGGGHAIQGIVAFDLVERDHFLAIVDYVWHPTIITTASAFDLGWHVGAGAFVAFWWRDHRYDCRRDPAIGAQVGCRDTLVGFGAHVPIGLDMLMRAVPIELSLEAAPGVRVFPPTDFSIFVGLAARYFF